METSPDTIAAPPGTTADVAQKPPGGFRRFGPAGILAILALVLPVSFLPLLAAHMDWLRACRAFLNDSAAGPLICVLIFTAIVGVALLPTITLSFFAGWAFGFPIGAGVALLSFAGGAYINYVIARRAAGDNVVDSIASHPRWAAIHRAILGGTEYKTFLIIALLRLPTVPPFGATTIALAAMRVRLRPFLLGTVAGCIPRTTLYVWLASRLQPDRFDPSDPTGGTQWFTLILSAVATLTVLTVIAVMARRALKKITAAHAATA